MLARLRLNLCYNPAFNVRALYEFVYEWRL